jgi:hypothetical protein
MGAVQAACSDVGVRKSNPVWPGHEPEVPDVPDAPGVPECARESLDLLDLLDLLGLLDPVRNTAVLYIHVHRSSAQGAQRGKG